MKNSRFWFPTIAASLVFVSSAVLAGDAGPPSGISVNVVNAPSNAVPVTLQGTGAISGNVAVTNTPRVRDADNPAFQSVQVDVEASLNVSGSLLSAPFIAAYTVPAGKRFVIEHVGMVGYLNGFTTTGRLVLYLGVKDSAPGSVFNYHGIGASSESAPCTLSQACIAIAQPVRIYANPGALIIVNVSGTSTPLNFGSSAEVTVNGHLVDI
jgi:hypothetical protein